MMSQVLYNNMESFENYKESAIWYLKHDSNTMFKTYTREQAKFIVELFIKYSMSSIIILSGHFPDDFYMKDDSKLLNETIARFRQISGRIRVITLNNGNNKLEKLSKASNGILEYKKAYIKRPGIMIPHFMVVDGKRYRLENIHEKGSIEIQTQICCNDIKTSNYLTNYFNLLWDKLSK